MKCIDIPNSEQIIKIAKENAVDAVIPGYGFLSENPDFARQLCDNGIEFVGPSANVIESLGLKHTARQYAIEASLPIVPGSPGLVVDEQQAVEIACKIGFPVSYINILSATVSREVSKIFNPNCPFCRSC